MICSLCRTIQSDGSGLCSACRETLDESHHLSTKRKNKSSSRSPSQYSGHTNSSGGGLIGGFAGFVAFIAMLAGSSE